MLKYLVIIMSSLGSRCVPWLDEGLRMPSPNYPVLCCLLPYRVAAVFAQVVFPPLGWSPLSYFLVIWSPSGDTRGASVVFEAVDMPCPGHLIFLTVYIISTRVVSHLARDTPNITWVVSRLPPPPPPGPQWHRLNSKFIGFKVHTRGRKFVLCLFGQCRLACHDSSLYLFVLVLFPGAVVLSQDK